jgi:hypothetical protein
VQILANTRFVTDPELAEKNVFPPFIANVTVRRMRRQRTQNGFLSLTDTLPVARKVGGGTQTLPPIVASIMMLAVLMAACSRAQSSGESKLPVPTRSAIPAMTDLSAQKLPQPQQAVMRTVKVKFDYDFSKFPACSAKITKKCVQQFNVYEVSSTPPIFLFSIPVPPNARGKVTGIPGAAPQKQAFFTGPHRVGVTAKGPGLNEESDPYQCMTFVQVLPDNPSAPTSSNSSPKK